MNRTFEPTFHKKTKMIFANCALDSTISKANEPAESAELNPPQWPASVHIIDSTKSDKEIQDELDGLQEQPTIITSDMTSNQDLIGTKQFVPTEHFYSERKVIFFEPREEPYKVDVQVGYYVQVAGLGASAKDVKFADNGAEKKKGPYCPAYFNTKLEGLTTLDTFWRSAENYSNLTKDGQLWAVSQAAPIRRIHTVNDLNLNDKGAQSSGGHLANVQVDGALVFGSQQQFCSRSVTVGDSGAINLGAWSNVFVDTVAPEGCLKTPAGWSGAQFGKDTHGKDLSLETRADNWRAADWSTGSVDKDGASTTVNVPKTTVEKLVTFRIIRMCAFAFTCENSRFYLVCAHLVLTCLLTLSRCLKSTGALWLWRPWQMTARSISYMFLNQGSEVVIAHLLLELIYQVLLMIGGHSRTCT